MKPDKVTESIDYVFKMCRDNQIDEDEAKLVLDAIFSGELNDNDFEMLRLVYLIRSQGDSNEAELLPDVQGITITIEMK